MKCCLCKRESEVGSNGLCKVRKPCTDIALRDVDIREAVILGLEND